MLAALQAYFIIKNQVFGDDSDLPDEEEAMNPKIQELLKEYDLSHETYQKVSDILLAEMEKGLNKDTNPSAIIKMIGTFVRGLPNGSERGDYLALDLGGTNFRVLLIKLLENDVKMENKIFPISEEIMLGPGTQLFDHIAQCIFEFMKEHKLLNPKTTIPLGFTFSFPCAQESLNVGRLIRWTKGFKCAGVEGEDVVKLLHEAVKRRGDLDVECVALLNDTVGCLMSCAFSDHNCEIGVILGTGTNACYMEKLDKVGTWTGDHNEPKQVIINTEWGAFGELESTGKGVIDFIRTKADVTIDQNSLNPGKQLYEKMISGMYMGEIARLVIVEAVQKGFLLNGELTSDLGKAHRFYTKYVSEIEKDSKSNNYTNTRHIMEELGYESISIEDLASIYQIAHIVGKRAAYLASAGIATLLNRINKPNITVAVDGSLYRFHPLFHSYMVENITSLLKPGIKFKLMLSEDGSGKGAALVAAVSARILQTQPK